MPRTIVLFQVAEIVPDPGDETAQAKLRLNSYSAHTPDGGLQLYLIRQDYGAKRGPWLFESADGPVEISVGTQMRLIIDDSKDAL